MKHLILIIILCFSFIGCEKNACDHEFSKWGELTKTNSMHPSFIQTKTCGKCGYSKVRRIKY